MVISKKMQPFGAPIRTSEFLKSYYKQVKYPTNVVEAERFMLAHTGNIDRVIVGRILKIDFTESTRHSAACLKKKNSEDTVTDRVNFIRHGLFRSFQLEMLPPEVAETFKTFEQYRLDEFGKNDNSEFPLQPTVPQGTGIIIWNKIFKLFAIKCCPPVEENPEWEQIDEFKELWSDFLEKMLSFVTSCLRDHSANSLNNQKWSSSLSKLLGITITKWTTVFGSRKCYEPFSDITLKLHDSYSNSGVESMSRSIAICLQDDSITMGQEFMKGILIPCGRILVGTERGFAERQVGFRIWELAIRRNWISVFLWPEENSFWCSMWQAMHFWRHILILKGVNIPNENKHYDILELGKMRRDDIEAQIEQIKKMMISMLYAVIAMVTHDTFLFCTCSISDSAIYRKKGAFCRQKGRLSLADHIQECMFVDPWDCVDSISELSRFTMCKMITHIFPPGDPYGWIPSSMIEDYLPSTDAFRERSRVDFMHHVYFQAFVGGLPKVAHRSDAPCRMDKAVMIAKQYKSYYATDPECRVLKAQLESIIKLPPCAATPCHTITSENLLRPN